MDTTFETMDGPSLKAAYNEMVKEAQAAGLNNGNKPYKEVNIFADRATGIKRCQRLQSELRAHAAGQAAADRQENTPYEEPEDFVGDYAELKEAGGLRSEPVPAPLAELTETNPGNVEPPALPTSAPSYGPGMERLRHNADLEAIRQRTLEAQERASEEVSEMARKAKEPKQKKAKEPKQPKNGHLSAKKARDMYNTLVESLSAVGVENLKVYKSEGGPVAQRARWEALRETLKAVKHPLPPEIREVLAQLPAAE